MRKIKLVVLSLLVSTPAFGSNWSETVEHDDIVYFLISENALIERYNLNEQRFLDAIPIAGGTPIAMDVGRDGIYYSLQNEARVHRVDLDGGNPVTVHDPPATIEKLFSMDDTLFVEYDAPNALGFLFSELLSIDKGTFDPIDTVQLGRGERVTGFSVSSLAQRIFYKDNQTFLALDIGPDGTFGDVQGYDRSFETAGRPSTETYVFGDGQYIIEGGGSVIDTLTLTLEHTTASNVSGAGFLGPNPVAFRDDLKFILYDEAYIEIGAFEPFHPSETFHTRGQFLFSFYSKNAGFGNPVGVDIFPSQTFANINMNTPVSPVGVAYEPADMVLATNGILYLIDNDNLQVHRLNTTTGGYMGSIPMAEPAHKLALLEDSNLLIVATERGKISSFDITFFYETHIASSPTIIRHIEGMGDQFIVHRQRARLAHLYNSYNGQGDELSALDPDRNFSQFMQWSPANRNLYVLGQPIFSQRIGRVFVGENGVLDPETENSVLVVDGVSRHFRVSPDASLLVMHDGKILDGESFEQVNQIGGFPVDSAWVDEVLFSVSRLPLFGRGASNSFLLRRWDPSDFTLAAETEISGIPLRLFEHEGNLYVIGMDDDGIPFIKRFDQDLIELPLLVDKSLCESSDDIAAESELLAASDIDFTIDAVKLEGLPVHASLALMKEIACTYEAYLAYATQAAFSLDAINFSAEPDILELQTYQHLVPAIMAISVSAQTELRTAFADNGLTLGTDYLIATDAGLVMTRTTSEPYSGLGDLDDDGKTNAQEWDEIIGGGGTLEDFVRAATGQRALGGGGRGRCLIATMAYGTPLAGELDGIRGWRDTYLMGNPAGALIADTYYRLSPSAVSLVERLAEKSNVVAKFNNASGAVLLGLFALYLRRRRSLSKT